MECINCVDDALTQSMHSKEELPLPLRGFPSLNMEGRGYSSLRGVRQLTDDVAISSALKLNLRLLRRFTPRKDKMSASQGKP